MTRRLRLLGLFTGLTMAASASSVSAQMLVEDWTLNLAAVGNGLGFRVDDITTIDVVGASSIARAFLIDNNGTAGVPEVGDEYRIGGLLRVEGFLDSAGDPSPSTGGFLNPASASVPCAGCYEVTAHFDVNVRLTSVAGGALVFTNEAGGNLGGGVGLRLYADNLDAANLDGGVQSSRTTGLGYTDGVEIASFSQLAGAGGFVAPGIGQGSTASNFELVAALPGVILDAPPPGGNDLGLLTGDLIAFLTEQILTTTPPIGITNPLDVAGPTSAASPIRSGFPFTDPTANPKCAGLIPGGSTGCVADFYNTLDPTGQLFLPEPTTLGVMGMGLLGLGIAMRRRRKLAAA